MNCLRCTGFSSLKNDIRQPPCIVQSQLPRNILAEILGNILEKDDTAVLAKDSSIIIAESNILTAMWVSNNGSSLEVGNQGGKPVSTYVVVFK